ncbi:hypothetical protein GCM10010230_68260 [Streptomyces narbonensis]|nr:hypothetical protein GCM10010230_68260 [Streptomyces narbonensis]
MEMSDKEFRAFVMSKLTEMEEKRDNELLKRKEKEVAEFQEMRKFLQDLKEELHPLQKTQTELLEMKSIIQEVKISLESIQSRLDHSENRISDVEEKMAGLEKSTTKTEKMAQKFENDMREVLDTIKRPNIRIIGIPEGEETHKGIDNLFHEILQENFPNLERHSKIQSQEIQRTPNRINPRRSSPRPILTRLTKTADKDKILRLAREKHQVTYKGHPIRLTADLSSETMRARREWENIFKVLREKQFQPRILYPARLSFRWEEKTRTFSDKQNLKEFTSTRPDLQEVLKGVLYQEN